MQFGHFLASNLSIGDYTTMLPPMGELLTRYHVNSDLAFFLARPMFNHQVKSIHKLGAVTESSKALPKREKINNKQLPPPWPGQTFEK